jgi:hypothetical protein
MGLLARQPTASEPTEARSTPLPPPPGPTILLTPDGWLVGDLVDTPGRVSDALAGRESVGLLTDVGYREVDRDDVLLIVPPPCIPRPELQIAKRHVPVRIDLVEGMTVRGLCHVRPGGTLWDTWQRSASGFAALTEAVIGFPDGTTEPAGVVLVSRHVAGAGLRPD